MPLVEISVGSGRDRDRLRTLISSVHRAVTSSLEVPDESVRVIVREVPPELWAAGDVTLAERDRHQGDAQ